MAINFPNNPGIGSVFTDATAGFSYEWDGTLWKSYAAASSSNIKILDDISSSFNGSTLSFPITSSAFSITPLNSASLRINLGGVIQAPGTDYNVSGSNIVFSTAPTASLSFSGISLGPAVPVDYANNGNVYTRNAFTATAGQTVFTITGTYTVGYIDVYQNGVRLTSGTDYTATNGTTFVLTTPANLNDEVESVAYKVATLVTTLGQLDNLLVTGISTLTGQTNASNISASGIITATSFVGSGAQLTGIVSGVGINTAGGVVGTGATVIDFRGTAISTVTVASGIATVNIKGGTFSAVNYIIN